ncbi:MAG: site-specific integrase [Candidatus Omnitrophica bacterium]|nr:site-specific integrase [Candidatus Omnitrophota bacterium]
MKKPAIQNESIKQEFFFSLKHDLGRDQKTIDIAERAIALYQDFTINADFRNFNKYKAVEFKEYLEGLTHNGQPLSLATRVMYLQNLQRFFEWLITQKGYKSRIEIDAINCLNVPTKERRIATQNNPQPLPDLGYVKTLTGSIVVKSITDRRDQALIAFTYLTGMRDEALITFPLGCFNIKELVIKQDPQKGVKTKFSKRIPGIIFNFDDTLLQYLLDWIDLLIKKGWEPKDPLFPQSKRNREAGDLFFCTATDIERTRWKDAESVRDIFKARAKSAGLPYFPPKAFRSSAVLLALSFAKTGEEIKAISQCFGHEFISTTLACYGNMTEDKLIRTLKGMSFQKKEPRGKDKKLEQIAKILLDE